MLPEFKEEPRGTNRLQYGIGAVPGRTIGNVRQRAGRGWRQRGERLRTLASAAACVAPERRVISCLKRLS